MFLVQPSGGCWKDRTGTEDVLFRVLAAWQAFGVELPKIETGIRKRFLDTIYDEHNIDEVLDIAL